MTSPSKNAAASSLQSLDMGGRGGRGCGEGILEQSVFYTVNN